MKINIVTILFLVTTTKLCHGYGYAQQHLTTSYAVTGGKFNNLWTADDIRTPTTPVTTKRRVVRGVFFYTYNDNYNGKEIEMHELNPQAFSKLIASKEFTKKPAIMKSTFDLISFFDGRCEATISCKSDPENCIDKPCVCTTTTTTTEPPEPPTEPPKKSTTTTTTEPPEPPTDPPKKSTTTTTTEPPEPPTDPPKKSTTTTTTEPPEPPTDPPKKSTTTTTTEPPEPPTDPPKKSTTTTTTEPPEPPTDPPKKSTTTTTTEPPEPPTDPPKKSTTTTTTEPPEPPTEPPKKSTTTPHMSMKRSRPTRGIYTPPRRPSIRPTISIVPPSYGTITWSIRQNVYMHPTGWTPRTRRSVPTLTTTTKVIYPYNNYTDGINLDY